MGFIGRKTIFNKGLALGLLVEQIQATVGSLSKAGVVLGHLVTAFTSAIETSDESRRVVLEQASSDKAFASSVAYHFMMQFGFLVGGWMMLQSAERVSNLLKEGTGAPEFLTAKIHTAQFYCEQLLPRCHTHATAFKAGSDTIVSYQDDWF